MPSNVEIPNLGESISEVVLQQWLKSEGDQVNVDEPLCELESDKATVDLPSPVSGVLHQLKKAGETVRIGERIAEIEADDARNDGPKAKASTASAAAPAKKKTSSAEHQTIQPPSTKPPSTKPEHAKAGWKVAQPEPATPASEKAVERRPAKEEAEEQPADQVRQQPAAKSKAQEGVRRVPMSKIRRSIAERLVRAQQTTAMLTTFNEIDVTAVQELRKRHQDDFKKAHGVSLGLMSFFARASVLALKHFPAINAQIDGDDILYFEHVNLGVAVSTERGLVVPILQHAEKMSFAKIEQEIKRVAIAARDGKLSIEDLSGGTFTITNGGVFGSLLSTPILNPPQTGILGMHAIQDRPVAVQGEVKIRPMMYIALTYDHRLVDGSDAVQFLVRLKQLLEDPLQMILEI